MCFWSRSTKRAGIWLWPRKPQSTGIIGAILRNYRWLALAALINAALNPINFIFAGSVGVGAFSAWALSNKIVLLFNGLASVGVSAVLLPHFARLFVHRGAAGLRNQVYFLLIAGSWVDGAIALAVFEFADPLSNTLFTGNQVSGSHIHESPRVSWRPVGLSQTDMTA